MSKPKGKPSVIQRMYDISMEAYIGECCYAGWMLSPEARLEIQRWNLEQYDCMFFFESMTIFGYPVIDTNGLDDAVLVKVATNE